MAKQVEEFLVRYSSPATPPNDKINPDVVYTFGKDTKGTYVSFDCKKIYEKADMITALFSPVEGKWEDYISTK